MSKTVKVFRATRGYILLLLAALVMVVWVLVLGSRPISNNKTPVRVVIPNGTSASEIASILDNQRLIRSRFVFTITCRINGSSGKLKPGVYEFNRAMSLPAMVKALVNGDTLESWVTVPEGYTARQIADLLAQKQLLNSDEFVQYAISRGYVFTSYGFTIGDSLEGYLFPDTYLISRGMQPEEIIDKMLQAFERKVLIPNRPAIEQIIRNRLNGAGGSFNEGLHEILTIASMVEREAKVPKDRPLISAVLWNRLAKNMKLEVDATISYRPGESTENKDRVYLDDLQSDSEYNTYKFAGLPPGPICNPGAAAVRAVLHPAKVDYLFYVARPDGSHKFSSTFEEHVKAKEAIKNGKL